MHTVTPSLSACVEIVGMQREAERPRGLPWVAPSGPQARELGCRRRRPWPGPGVWEPGALASGAGEGGRPGSSREPGFLCLPRSAFLSSSGSVAEATALGRRLLLTRSTASDASFFQKDPRGHTQGWVPQLTGPPQPRSRTRGGNAHSVFPQQMLIRPSVQRHDQPEAKTPFHRRGGWSVGVSRRRPEAPGLLVPVGAACCDRRSGPSPSVTLPRDDRMMAMPPSCQLRKLRVTVNPVPSVRKHPFPV